MRPTNLYTLKLQRERLEKELGQIKTQIMYGEDAAKRKRTEISEIDTRISEFKDGHTELGISDHAVARYIERVLKLNINELKYQIVPTRFRDALKTMDTEHDLKFPVTTELGAYTLVINNGVVVTIYTKNQESY